MPIHTPFDCSEASAIAPPRRRRPRSSRRLAAIVAATSVGVAAWPAAAAILVVDRLDDPPLGSAATCTAAAADCSLRQAIELANQAVGPTTTIELGEGIYVLSQAGADEDGNQTGDLDYLGGASALKLVGLGAGRSIVEQSTTDRLLDLGPSAGTVLVESLTLRGGSGVEHGGALSSGNARLELRDVVVRDSASLMNGGCLERVRLSPDHGTLLERVTFSGCNADYAGGALVLQTVGDAGPTEILASRFENNQAAGSSGAASFSLTTFLLIEDTVFTGNVSLGGSGGGAWFFDLAAIIRRSAFVDNVAGAPDGPGGEGGGAVVAGAVVNLENVTFARNRTHGPGGNDGGMLVIRGSDVDLVHTTFTEAPPFGAVRVEGSSAVELDNSIIDGGCSIEAGVVTSAQSNVERPWQGASSTCNLGPGDLVVADVALRPPAIYGGPHGVPTQALLPGSAAGGLVSSADCADLDARTAPRLGFFCDAGAHETNAVAPGPWIFADGFESADTLAWSIAAP